MKQIFVLAEHRKGQLRDTTWEAIAAGRKLAADLGVELSCLLLGSNTDAMAEALAKECPKVIAVDDPSVRNFNSGPLTKALGAILQDRKPFMLIMCNSNSVLELAPGLSVVLDAALATDCFGFEVRDGKPLAWRQMYSYKVNTLISFKNAENIVVTLRGGFFQFSFRRPGAAGSVEKVPSPLGGEPLKKRFLNYLEAEKGDVDRRVRGHNNFGRSRHWR